MSVCVCVSPLCLTCPGTQTSPLFFFFLNFSFVCFFFSFFVSSSIFILLRISFSKLTKPPCLGLFFGFWLLSLDRYTRKWRRRPSTFFSFFLSFFFLVFHRKSSSSPSFFLPFVFYFIWFFLGFQPEILLRQDNKNNRLTTLLNQSSTDGVVILSFSASRGRREVESIKALEHHPPHLHRRGEERRRFNRRPSFY